MHIALIINAKAPDTVDQIRAGVERLREAGHRVEPRLTFESGDAVRFARDAAAAGAEVVVAGGGDGTINEVVNGLHASLREGGERPPPRLAILPLGTANDLAHNLSIPVEVDAALQLVVEGVPKRLNVGVVNERCFLNVSTGGFGAEATGAAPAAAKRALGTLAYLVEGIRRFAALEQGTARFTAEETVHDGPFLLFAVGNSRRTGGGTELTPDADEGDGLLDVCIIKELTRVEFLGLLPDLRAGEHLDHPAVIYRQVRTLEVEAEAEMQVNADGEPIRGRRFHYSLSPFWLQVMVPAEGGTEPE